MTNNTQQKTEPAAPQAMTVDKAFELGVRLFDQGRLNDAENLIRQLVVQFPTHDAGRLLLARTYYLLNDFDRVLEVLQPAMARNPNNGRMRAVAGSAALRLGRVDEASELIDTALVLNADLVDAHRARAEIAMICGDYTEAVTSLRKALELIPTSPVLRGLLAEALMAAGDFDRAIDEFSVWARSLPQSDIPHYLLGMLVSRAESCGAMSTEVARDWLARQAEAISRETAKSLYQLYLSGMEFRNGNRSKANHLCSRAAKTLGDLGLIPVALRAGWSNAQAGEVGKLIAGRAEYWPEKENSVYQDETQLRRLYNEYIFTLGLNHPHGHGTTIAGWHLRDQARQLLSCNPDIDAVANFGCFAGAIDQGLAQEFPQRQFYGVDRSPLVKARNEDQFAAPNLEYFAADIADWLETSPPVSNGLLFHSRTAIYVMPAKLERIYRLAREKGYRHVLLLENFGIDRKSLAWPSFGSGFASYLLRNRMLAHDYPAILGRAGFASDTPSYVPMCNPVISLTESHGATDLAPGAWGVTDFHLLCLHASVT